MAAITPTKPSFYGSIGNLKLRVWYSPVISASTAETITVPGIKLPFLVTDARPAGVVSWTSSIAANGLGCVVSMQVTASSTGNYAPLMVMGY